MRNKYLFAVAILGLLFSTFAVKGQLTSTNLPIIKLTTTAPITNTQTQATISIINNASGINTPSDAPQYSGMIGIDLRGSSTIPKLSYNIETWSQPDTSLDVSLLGMPTENDWVLISAYADRSLMRNNLSYLLHENMGKYSPRMKFCELLLDNQYKGVYLFGEKIKRDTFRVDIAKLKPSDNTGEQLTGGYIFKLDNGTSAGWTSQIPPPYASTQIIEFKYDEPSNGDLTPVQKDYIKAYVDSFETAMNASNFQDTTLGWRRFASQGSFIDYIIMQEVSKNQDAYRINAYLYKDKGKKLRVGPMWNGELSWWNAADCQGSVDTGFCYNLGAYCATVTNLVPFWYQKLMGDTTFKRELTCAYTQYRKPGNALDTTKIFHLLDSMSNYVNLQNAVTRNFTQWPIWGVPLQNEPTPMSVNHAQEIASIKSFIKARLAWLDVKWAPTGGCVAPLGVDLIAFEQFVEIYPNPTSSVLNINISGKTNFNAMVDIYTLQGLKLKSEVAKNNHASIDISQYPAGMYLIQVKSSVGSVTRKIIKE